MKKLMFSLAAMAIMGAASYVTLRSNDSDREFTALELANIEALTHDETVDPDCRYINGYKKWFSEKPNADAALQEFYDCCRVLRSGYCVSEACN